MRTIREIWEYREMVQSLVRRDLRGRYKASVLGFLWTFIVPLCQLLVYTVVFSVILQSGIEKFYLYLFIGLIPWNFFSTCLTGGASCILQQQSLVNKIFFPREVVPVSFVTAAFVNMLYCEIVVFAVCIFSGVHFSLAGLLCLPVVMLIEYIFTLGITMIISALDVYFRDLEHILGILSMAWMFMTPIMYDISIVPENLMPVFQLNPMTSIITAYRDIMYAGSVPKPETLGVAAGMGVLFLLVGFLVFGKMKRRFSEVM
ncbi:MAG: ABC transporter permease [Clostridia bacterium]|nr:ABC transporter permease [Clostridia bacterium]